MNNAEFNKGSNQQADQPPRKRKSFDTLTPNSEEYQPVSGEASLYSELISKCDEEGRQPRESDYKDLASELDVHINTARNRFKRFVAEGYDGLLNHAPGSVAGAKLTEKQHHVLEAIALNAVLMRKSLTVLHITSYAMQTLMKSMMR